MSNVPIVQRVSDLERAKNPLNETSPKQAIEALVRSNVEACSEYSGTVVASEYHPFVAAVHAAFCDHRPLVLSPDMFWLLIAHGLARHVNANSEKLRHRFVQHDRRKKILVRRDDFIKGSLENPWGEVFDEFSAQIKKHIGEENHSNIVASFSTTGTIEKAANEIALMDTLQNYFEYFCSTLCGIPEVKLEGTVEDWSELPKRAEAIGSRYDLAWWTDRMVPTLDRIARNAAGADDPELWNHIYKIDNKSGGPYINGWLVDFFPYLQTTRREEQIDQRNWLFSGEGHHGISTVSLPSSLCTAPFKWQYFNRQYEMEFVAGFIGFTQNEEDLAVRPKIGWAVREVARGTEAEHAWRGILIILAVLIASGLGWAIFKGLF